LLERDQRRSATVNEAAEATAFHEDAGLQAPSASERIAAT
jgi:hypothetical protein